MKNILRKANSAIIFLLLYSIVLAIFPIAAAQTSDHNSVYDYEIVSATQTNSNEITVKVQARFCSSCNPNDASNPGDPAFPLYTMWEDGRFTAVSIKDSNTGDILGIQKLVCNPINWPIDAVVTNDFVFTDISLDGVSTVTVDADIYCSWCGHWYPSPVSLEITSLKILIDSGHSPTDLSIDKKNEYAINKGVADKLQSKLKAEGIDVYLTNPIGIPDRINYANTLEPDLFVSLHCNAFKGESKGSEVWIYDDTDSSEQAINEKDLSVRTLNGLSYSIDSKIRPPVPKEKEDPWPSGIPIIKGVTVCPAVLLELEFFDYSSEVIYKGVTYKNMLELMNTNIWREDAAQGIFNGIDGYLSSKGLTVTAYSPVDFIVTDPDGLIISKEINEIPGAIYTETDFDENGDLDDQVRIPNRKIGEYTVTVIPETGALPTDKYTLEFSLFGVSKTLAKDVQISDVPTEPYLIESTSDGIVPQIIESSVEIEPETLNLKSSGKWITAYIELPEGFDINNIDVQTIMLNNQVQAENNPTKIDDYDNDGTADLMIKFNREATQKIIELGEKVKITVSGEFIDGLQFEGIDTIRVIGN